VTNVFADQWNTEEHRKELLIAAAAGDVACVRFLASQGVDVTTKDSKGNTSLHSAAQNGHLEVVKYLINNTDIDIECYNQANNTPLHVAAWNDRKHVVKYLINQGVNLNPKSYNGSVPMHMAAVTGYSEIVSLLLNAGAHVNAIADNGRLPIHSAARKGQLSIVQRLVEHGAYLYACDVEGLDALDVALLGNHTETATYLTSMYRTTAINGMKKSGWWLNVPRELNEIILNYTIPEQAHPMWREAPQEVAKSQKGSRVYLISQSPTDEAGMANDTDDYDMGYGSAGEAIL